MMDRLVEVIHTEKSEGHFFLLFDVLLGQEILVCKKFILVFVASLVQLIIAVKVLGKDNIESPVVIVVLH